MTINLLPQEIRTQRAARARTATMVLIISAGLGLIALLDVALLGFKTILESNIRTQEAAIEQVNQEMKRYAELAGQVTDAQMRGEEIKKILDARPEWTAIFGAFAQAIPTSASISNFNGSLSTSPNITVNAIAPSIRDAEKFRASLDASKMFQNTILGAFSTSGEGDVSFSISTDLEKQIVKEGDAAQ